MTLKKNPFYIHVLNTETDDVLKTIKSLRNDCWTGYSNVPVSLTKPGVKLLRQWKITRINRDFTLQTDIHITNTMELIIVPC